MAKLKISGKASHEYSCDCTEVTVRFQVHEQSTSAALEKVLYQCEDFLSIIHEDGISMDSIRIGEDSVEQEYEDKQLDVCATREVAIRVPFDMGFVNHIMTLIKDKHYSADIDTVHSLTNLNEIHNELIKEAIGDSKKKASFIVEVMGQKLIGIESVEIGDSYRHHRSWLCEGVSALSAPIALDCSNLIQSPITVENETVEVVWLIE